MMMVIAMVNKQQLIKLCKQHDVIKDSEIRFRGIRGEILPQNGKVRYMNIVKDFVDSSIAYLNENKETKEIKKVFRWMKEKKGYDLQEIVDDLFDCYTKYDDDEFIAALDFLVLSKVHYIIEYTYLQFFNETYTKDFLERFQ